MSIVVIGGGTGVAALVRPLKEKMRRKRKSEKVYTVHGVSDCGGHSRLVRDEYNIIPPGDWRRGFESLTRSEKVRRDFAQRIQTEDGGSISVGNLIITSTILANGGDIPRSLIELKKKYHISGLALPVSLFPTHIKTRLHTGEEYENEVELGERAFTDSRSIVECYLDPPVEIYEGAAKVVSEAHLAIMGPGSFFTSIVTNALVKGFNEALAKSRVFVFVVNLVTDSETRGWEAHHFVRQITWYTGRVPDVVICNDRTKFPPGILQRYYAQRSFPVSVDVEKLKLTAGTHNMRIVLQRLATAGDDGRIRHTTLLADTILSLCESVR